MAAKSPDDRIYVLADELMLETRWHVRSGGDTAAQVGMLGVGSWW